MKDNMRRDIKIPFDVNGNMVLSFHQTHKAMWSDNFTRNVVLQNISMYAAEVVTFEDSVKRMYYMQLKHLVPLIPRFKEGKINLNVTFYRDHGYYYIKEYIREEQLAPFDLWGGIQREDDRWSVCYTREELESFGKGYLVSENIHNQTRTYVAPEMKPVTTLTLDLELQSIYGIASGFAVRWKNVQNEKQTFPMNSKNYIEAIPYIHAGKLSGTFTVTNHSGYYSLKLVI